MEETSTPAEISFLKAFALLKFFSNRLRIKTYLQKFWGGLTEEYFREKHCFIKKGVEIWAFEGTLLFF